MSKMTKPVSKNFGPYKTIKLIGSGGQSAVYSAIHEQTQVMVVLRVMTVMHRNSDKAIQDCEAVLAEVKNLNIPHIVAIEDFGHDDGVLYIAMTVLKGGTLLERMRRRYIGNPDQDSQLPSANEVLKMTEPMAIALDALHAEGLVHGQLEPDNIMFDEHGQAFLADIGLTRLTKILYRLEATNSFNMSKYSAPELWDGYRPSASTDQYALACIIYELLTGQAPFNAPSIFDLMQAHANEIAPPPHYVHEGLPGSLAMIFWQALAKPVDRRFPNIITLYENLRESLEKSEDEPTNFFTFTLN
jgi:serine/threonine protein kinase